jgi:hypothetical protein
MIAIQLAPRLSFALLSAMVTARVTTDTVSVRVVTREMHVISWSCVAITALLREHVLMASASAIPVSLVTNVL